MAYLSDALSGMERHQPTQSLFWLALAHDAAPAHAPTRPPNDIVTCLGGRVGAWAGAAALQRIKNTAFPQVFRASERIAVRDKDIPAPTYACEGIKK